MPNSVSRPTLTRRRFTQLSGMLEIAPYTLETSPKHHLRTVAYNSQIPGPLFQMREGEPQSVEIRNLTKDSEVVHWHGLYLPPVCARDVVVLVHAGGTVEVEFVADNPGKTLFHCHQQDHMDRGFKMVFNYA